MKKHEVTIRRVTMKYKHTHMAFVEALSKVLTERLFKVQDAQELNDPEQVSLICVKHLYGLVDHLNDAKTQMTGIKPKDVIELKKVLKCVMARVQQQNRKLQFFCYCGFVYNGTIATFGMLIGYFIV